MRRSSVLVLISVCALVGCAQDSPPPASAPPSPVKAAPPTPVKPAPPNDAAMLEGEWSMVSGQANGQAMPPEMAGTGKRVAKDGVTTVTIGGQLYFKASFTIDAFQTPKAIDYAMTEGPTKGSTQFGIYDLQGDTVTFCFAAPGLDRPTDFTAEAGSERALSVWRKDPQ